MYNKLARRVQPPKIAQLGKYCRKLVKMSRTDMSKKYPAWDVNNDTYRGVRERDEEDIEAAENDEPEKQVIPMSYAQIQTFCAFQFMLYRQGPHFFDQKATGTEDFPLRESIAETLDRDLRQNRWPTRLYQSLLDVGRFSLAPVKSTWVRETQWVPTLPKGEGAMQGMVSVGSVREVTKYHGNRIENIDPFRFFPDTRKTMAHWYEGEFVADEEEVNVSILRGWERNRIVAGVKFIEPMDEKSFDSRGGDTRLPNLRKKIETGVSDNEDFPVVRTCIQVNLIPDQWDLGPEQYPMKWLIELANDERVIRADRMGYVHDQWTYDLIQFSPDMQQQVNESLSDVLFALQDVNSFIINSRLQSIRKSLENNLIVDQSAVDMDSLESRNPYILVTKSAARMGVSKFVQQLPFQDATAAHMNDAQTLMNIMQMVTGINENAMGQFHGGRRSATEARSVNSGASARLRMVGQIMWNDGYSQLGQKMLLNQRQGLDIDSFAKILGETTENVQELYQHFKPMDPAELVGNVDYFTLDTTTEIEKGLLAQSLQELVVGMLGSPEGAAMMNFNMSALIREILHLKGVENVDRFALDKALANGDLEAQNQLESIVASAVAQQSQAVPEQSGLQAV
jgi:hypothetical protein